MYHLAVAAAALALSAQALNVHDFPKTSFSCRDKNAGEYYADLELGCQVYHICAVGQFNRLTKMSFACPNGTLFSQSSRICNSEDKVYCQLSERYYDNVQGNIDTQDDYRTVFQVTDPPVFPLEPRRPARRPASQNDNDDDYDDSPASSAPRRPTRRPASPARPSTTTSTAAPRQRPPQRQFQPQIPATQQQSSFNPLQDNRPPAGGFLPPRANTRFPAPGAPQLVSVTQSPFDQRPGFPSLPPLPSQGGQPTLQTSAPQSANRLVANRPAVRRPTPLGGSTQSAPSTTASPATTTTTADPNAEYEYYDYEEPADGNQQSNNQ